MFNPLVAKIFSQTSNTIGVETINKEMYEENKDKVWEIIDNYFFI